MARRYAYLLTQVVTTEVGWAQAIFRVPYLETDLQRQGNAKIKSYEGVLPGSGAEGCWNK